VHVQGALLEVAVDGGGAAYRLVTGAQLVFTHGGVRMELTQAVPFKRVEAA
jgi:hypothetical protein